ncbi:ISNCY family transposase [Undibacterium arcticum]
MSDKEILRGHLMAQLLEGKLDQRAVAARLAISVRQVKRLKRSYAETGIAGLISKKRGQPSHRRIRDSVLSEAMALIGAHYADFGPTLATEKLAEQHAITLSVETVRQYMIAAGYWQPRRGQTIRAHPLRERRARRGELIQIDGSPHDWFEGRAPRCCLLVFIDDATGELMELQFVDTETTLGYMAALQRHIQRHGLPAALYSDRHSIFRINAPAAPSQAQTQFARALAALGIDGIQANSPQAKGRVERANQTLQDRLIKEMRLVGLNDQASANSWLPTFMTDFNRRFAVKPARQDDAHVAYRGKTADLCRILSVQAERCLSKNLSCQYESELLQVQTRSQGLSLRGAKVRVHCHHDGRMELLWHGRALAFEKVIKPQKQTAPIDGKAVNARMEWVLEKRGRTIPPPDHPF